MLVGPVDGLVLGGGDAEALGDTPAIGVAGWPQPTASNAIETTAAPILPTISTDR